MTAELIELLKGLRLRASIVLHVNHPNEIDGAFIDALAALHRGGIQLFNQSVLLRGVNDAASVLEELSQRLFDNHVLPYYLHLPDRVVGTHHFDVSERDREVTDCDARGTTARLPRSPSGARSRRAPREAGRSSCLTAGRDRGA